MLSRVSVFSSAVFLFVWLPAQAQPVISAQSGLIHFSEGAVTLDGAPLTQTFGKFAQMKDGSELATRDGRAEVMLTPGVFLRLGEDSTVRMLSNNLADTRLQFLTGAVIIDASNGSANAPVTIVSQGYQVRLLQPGQYRFESVPAELRVESGEAEVLHDGKATVVGAQSVFSFVTGLTAQNSSKGPGDALDNWNRARADSIAESNDAAGKATDLSAAIDGWDNDPFGALGMPGYMPRSGYTPLSTYTPLWSNSPVIAVPGIGTLAPWGIGAASPLGLYPLPIYGYYPYSTLYGPGYLGSRPFPLHRGTGIGTYRPPAGYHPASPVHSGHGSIGHAGGHR